MENIVDLIASDAPASEISDAIKANLFARSAENIEMVKPAVAASLFGLNDEEGEE